MSSHQQNRASGFMRAYLKYFRSLRFFTCADDSDGTALDTNKENYDRLKLTSNDSKLEKELNILRTKLG
jgi:hypothetical protein